MWSKFLPACVTVPNDADYSWHQRDQVWGRQRFVIIPKCFLHTRFLNAGLPKNLCWWISVQTSPCRLELVPFCSCHELFVYRSKLVGVSERDFLSSLVRDLHTWTLPYNMFQKIEVLHLSSPVVTVPYSSVRWDCCVHQPIWFCFNGSIIVNNGIAEVFSRWPVTFQNIVSHKLG